jgi:hypothetical protein
MGAAMFGLLLIVEKVRHPLQMWQPAMVNEHTAVYEVVGVTAGFCCMASSVVAMCLELISRGRERSALLHYLSCKAGL